MIKRFKFMAVVDGATGRMMETYAIDRDDIAAQLREIFTEGALIEIFLLQEC